MRCNLTIYRIYSRSQDSNGPWRVVCLGDYSHIPKEWSDLEECREAFKRYVADEQEMRRRDGDSDHGLWIVPFSPREYKIVAIPTVDIEVSDAPHSPPSERAKEAKPNDGHPGRVNAAAKSSQPHPGAGHAEHRTA